jgi:predicted Zn-dependent protease
LIQSPAKLLCASGAKCGNWHHANIEILFVGNSNQMTGLARVTMSGRDIEDIVRVVLAEAKKHGADQAEAAASHDLGIAATARLGTVENLEYTNDRGVGVTVFCGTRKGSAGTSDFSAEALCETVKKACAFARYTEADACAGLADADRMATSIPDLDLAHAWPIESEEAIAIAVESEDAARSFDKRVTNSEGATVSTSSGIRAYGNTHGFLASYRKSSHSISCVVVGEQNGDMQRDYPTPRPGIRWTWKQRKLSASAQQAHYRQAGCKKGQDLQSQGIAGTGDRTWLHRTRGRCNQRRCTVPALIVPAGGGR